MTDKPLYHITFDTDWAPESSLSIVRSVLSQKGLLATFFATNNSDIVQDLIRDGHEIGLHPNFLSGTTQGESPVSIIANLLEIFPNAKVIRTHSLFQSSPLMHEIFSTFPQLKIDMSLLTHRFPHVGSFYWRQGDVAVRRVNFNWEDDVAFYDEGFDWSSAFFPGSINVFNFHPIHVHLNSRDSLNYMSLKRNLKHPLVNLEQTEADRYVNSSPGTLTFLNSIIDSDAVPLTHKELLCELD